MRSGRRFRDALHRSRTHRPGDQEAPTPVLETPGVVDLAWYSLEAGREFGSLTEAIAHYESIGADQSLSPHPLFDPTIVEEAVPGEPALLTYLSSPHLRRRRPHPGIDLAAYRSRVPEADAHPLGPGGHLLCHLRDDTVLPLRGAAGTTAASWSSVRASWQGLARTWTSQQRRVVPAFVAELPHDHRLPPLPQVPESPASLVSIVIPTWNRAAKLERALASVRAQTWQHWEAIVVDDGSEDDTATVMAGLVALDPRIRFLPREHEGVCAARNTAIDAASGGLIAFLDSDNEWQPDYLRDMVTAMTGLDLEAAYATLAIRTPEGVRYRARQVDRSVLLLTNHIDMNVLMVRHDLLRRTGGFDVTLRRTVDYDLVLRLTEHTDLTHVPIIGAWYDDDREDPHRITVREPAGWVEHVQARHNVDWQALRAQPRVDGLVSVVLPVIKRPAVVRAQVAELLTGLGDTPLEIVVVDVTPDRRCAGALASLVATDPRVRYVRVPRRISFSYAVDLGFAETTGRTLAVVEWGADLAAPGLAALLAAAPRQQEPFLVPVPAVDVEGAPRGDTRTFVTDAATFAAVHGLDVFMDEVLEVADLAQRLRAHGGVAVLDVPDVHAVVRAPTVGRPVRSDQSRRVFAERYPDLVGLGVLVEGVRTPEQP